MTTTQTTTAPAKPVKATEATVTWHTMYDQRIAKNPAEYGTVPSSDAYRLAGLLGGGKRDGVEALYIALTLRPEGCHPDVYVSIKGKHGYANNCLQYLNDEGKRHLYAVLHVTKVNGVRISRLTAKGEAQAKAAGLTATALKPFMKAPVTAKVPAKGTGAATGKPKATASATKPVPAKPTSEAPKPAMAPVHPVMTNDGPKVPVTETVKA